MTTWGQLRAAIMGLLDEQAERLRPIQMEAAARIERWAELTPENIGLPHRHRKPNRSRRIVKKLLKRSEGVTDWNRDAVSVDGGKRWVTAHEMCLHGLRHP